MKNDYMHSGGRCIARLISNLGPGLKRKHGEINCLFHPAAGMDCTFYSGVMGNAENTFFVEVWMIHRQIYVDTGALYGQQLSERC